MKKLLAIALLASGLMISARTSAQNEDKSKRPSPPATASAKLSSGATVTIDYGQDHWERRGANGWKGMAHRGQ